MKHILAAICALALVGTACGTGGDDKLTVYSGRSEELIGPLIEQFSDRTGVPVEVKYDSSSNLALLISEEGDRTPADIFISQSPGAIAFLAGQDLLQQLDSRLLDLVAPGFRSAEGLWVGLSGRARVIVMNRDLVNPDELPGSVFELTEPQYAGKVALAPANGSFQDFVTAMRMTHGDDAAAEWLRGMSDNRSPTYASNSAIVDAVARGEVPMGLVNHYYNFRAVAEDPSLPSENYYLPGDDIGSLIIITGVGILAASDNSEDAQSLIEFLLGADAQTYFTNETFEYPLATGARPWEGLPPLSDIGGLTPDFEELGGGLERTKQLIDASGFESS